MRFFAKTRTIILFANTTLNRLGFGVVVTARALTLPKQSCVPKQFLWELNSFTIQTLSLGLCYIIFAQRSRPAK